MATDNDPMFISADEGVALDTLPTDAARSVLEQLDAISLARVHGCSKPMASLVDAIAADLLRRHLRECRRRAAERSTFLPRQDPGCFVGTITKRGSLRLLGGMSCGGSHQLSLHLHKLMPQLAHGVAHGVRAASYCGRQVLLVRADGTVLGDGPGLDQGLDVPLCCECDAGELVGGGAEAEPEGDAMPACTLEEEEKMREEEEEAASRGWSWRPRTQPTTLGLGPPAQSCKVKALRLPEAIVAACACPGRSHLLGQSGALYSARWHGQRACRGPSSSPWSCWTPPSPALRVVEISALSAHVLLRTAGGDAMSFGDPNEGKLGYSSRALYVTTPRLIEGLAGHVIAGVAAGGRHSLFLTELGACFAAGANHAGQCGVRHAASTAGVLHEIALPDECARLVQAAAGHAHSLLLTHTGQVYACGLNDQGQCGIEQSLGLDVPCVQQPTLVSGLLPHTVRAIEAAPSLSAFEVDMALGDAKGQTDDDDHRDAAADGVALDNDDDSDATRAGCGGPCGGRSHSLWLAGHVESFNIPGTNAQVGGVRFMPSCYRWQLASV